jgi:cell division protein FtsB
MNETTWYAVISSVVTLVVAWFSFKKSNQDASATFQQSLLSRIESLEEDNEILRKKNEDLLNLNLQEREKQLSMEQKISQIENEKLLMLDRIQQLEEQVRSLIVELQRAKNKE